MKAWTDYPIKELGDAPGKIAPVRECEVVAFDGDKYATVIVEGIRTNFKAGYIYTEKGRIGKVPVVPFAEMNRLPFSY